MSNLDDLAGMLSRHDGAAKSTGPSGALRSRRGVISSVSVDGRPSVKLQGSDVEVGPLPWLGSYTPTVGDTVFLLGGPADLLILGVIEI